MRTAASMDRETAWAQFVAASEAALDDALGRADLLRRAIFDHGLGIITSDELLAVARDESQMPDITPTPTAMLPQQNPNERTEGRDG
jgi:hypothetical protein